METLAAFLRDDLHIILFILAGAYLVVRRAEKRPRWLLRLGAALLVISAWMLLTGVRDYSAFEGQALEIRSIARYLVLFALNVGAVTLYARVSFFPALFAASVGYSLQHLCERSWEIVRYSLSLPVWLDRLILIALMAGSLWLFERLAFHNREDFNPALSFDRLDRRVLLLVAVVVIFANIVMDLHLYSQAGLSKVMMNYSRMSSALIALMALVTSVCHIQETDSLRRAEIADRLLHAEQERFAQDKAIHDAINIKCHDIRHQIAALGEAGLRRELGDIGRMINIYDTASHSENTALDVVLSNKSLACLNLGITLSCIADGRHLAFMADEDVYALFGNILDNAMEAVAGITDPERRQITLSVSARGGFVLIEEENFFEGDISFREGLPQTRKDRIYHGYGLQSIRMLTDRYQGDLNISGENGIYHLSILFPLPSGKKGA